MTLDVKCSDFLQDNRHFYAVKARKKKMAIVRLEVTNAHASNVRLSLGSSQLMAAGKCYTVENPSVVLRKLSEFTWDFLLFAILDFHSIIALFEALVFLGGPLYNRRLRRKLALLSNEDLLLLPGQTKVALLAFRGVGQDLEQLTIGWCCEHGDPQQLVHHFG